MIKREQILSELNSMLTEENKERVHELISKVERMTDEELSKVLKERKVGSLKDIRKVVEGKDKKTVRTQKFENLNDVVSFGVTNRTLHIHLIPPDAHNMLTREGMKEAQISLIDAMEKIKVKLQMDKKYKKIEHVYAVSPIMTGIVSRWFKELGFDVKTLPIEQAKKDEELGKFHGKFEGATKLGRANLNKEELMTEEWEERKDALKEKLGISIKKEGFVETLQNMNNTDQEIVQASEEIEIKKTKIKEVKPEVIE